MINEKFQPERRQYSIVLIGDFNPAMFHPEWFRRHEIISPEESNLAQNSSNPAVVTPQLTIFQTTQLSVRIDQNRFQVVAQKEPLIVVKDFIVKTFEKLGALVIRAYGFNYSAQYKIATYKEYQLIGDRLAPKEYWADLLGDEVTGDERQSGLASLKMLKTKSGDETGQISVNLQPSDLFKPGIHLSCNDHTQIDEENSSAELVIEKIEAAFDATFKKMANLQIRLLEEVTKNEQ